MPTQPNSLPGGTQVQAKASQLKNTFQRFKRELREQNSASGELINAPSAPKKNPNSPIMFNSPSGAFGTQYGKFSGTVGDPEGVMEFRPEEREALIMAVRHIQTLKRAQ